MAAHFLFNQTKVEKKLCAVGKILDLMEDDEAKMIDSSFGENGIHSSTIWRYLRSKNYSVSLTTVKAHRRKDCNCEQIN
jgi:hypothetical protein